MPIVKGVSLLQQIKEANETWFSPENKKFFKDIEYKGRYGKKTHLPYLIRSTYGWTDMFGKQPRLHYHINPVNPDTVKIEDLIHAEFKDYDEVKEWLEEN